MQAEKLKFSGTLLAISSAVLCGVIAARLFYHGDWLLGLSALVLGIINFARNARERALLDKIKNMQEWRTSGGN